MKKIKILMLALSIATSVSVYAQAKGDAFDPNYDGYYLLKTWYTGEGLSLESNGAESKYMNGAAFMSTQKGATGQQWKFVEDKGNPGYYRMQTKLHSNKKCLEGNGKDSPFKNGASFMDDCKNVSGQLWKIELQDNGYYRIHAMSQGNETSLEARVDGTHGNNTFLDTFRDVTGQYWYLIKVK